MTGTDSLNSTSTSFLTPIIWPVYLDTLFWNRGNKPQIVIAKPILLIKYFIFRHIYTTSATVSQNIAYALGVGLSRIFEVWINAFCQHSLSIFSCEMRFATTELMGTIQVGLTRRQTFNWSSLEMKMDSLTQMVIEKGKPLQNPESRLHSSEMHTCIPAPRLRTHIVFVRLVLVSQQEIMRSKCFKRIHKLAV